MDNPVAAVSLLILSTLLAWATAQPALACSVPVFRYALERWDPDPYPVVVFHRGPLTGEAKQAAEILGGLASEEGQITNAYVTFADVATSMELPLGDLWKQTQAAGKAKTLPLLVVCFPAALGIEKTAWTGPLTKDAVNALIDSPARREIARRILTGQSAVWVLLECGDRKKDEAAAATLDVALKEANKTLELPDDMEDAEGEGLTIDDGSPAVRVDFSLFRVRRDDPKEKFLAACLLALNEDGKDRGAPIVGPVFGRGRMLGVLGGEDLEAEIVQSACEFLVGFCSCQIKDANPGVDMLVKANWNAMAGGELIGEQPAPPLQGFSEFADAAATGTAETTDAVTQSAPKAGPHEEVAAVTAGGTGALARSTLLVLAIATVGVLCAAGVFLLRGKRT